MHRQETVDVDWHVIGNARVLIAIVDHQCLYGRRQRLMVLSVKLGRVGIVDGLILGVEDVDALVEQFLHYLSHFIAALTGDGQPLFKFSLPDAEVGEHFQGLFGGVAQ